MSACYVEREVAERGIYLDFEGRGPATKNKPAPIPRFCGVLVDDEYQLYSLQEREERGILPQAEHVDTESTLINFCHMINKRASQENRQVIYFSEREKKVFEKLGLQIFNDLNFLGPIKSDIKVLRTKSKKASVEKQNKSLSKNKRAIAERYSNLGLLHHVGVQEGYEYPIGHPAGYVGKWVKIIEEQERKKKDYLSFSKGAKRKLAKLRAHNIHDLKCLEFLCQNMSRPVD